MGARAFVGLGQAMDMVYYIGVKGFAVRSPRLLITHPTDSGRRTQTESDGETRRARAPARAHTCILLASLSLSRVSGLSRSRPLSASRARRARGAARARADDTTYH